MLPVDDFENLKMFGATGPAISLDAVTACACGVVLWATNVQTWTYDAMPLNCLLWLQPKLLMYWMIKVGYPD